MNKKPKQIAKRAVRKSFIRKSWENINPVLRKVLAAASLLLLLFGLFQFIQWYFGTLDISIDNHLNNINGTPILRFNLINHYRDDLHGIYSTAILTCENNYTEPLSTQPLDSGYSVMIRNSDKDIITSQDDRYSSIVNLSNDCADAYFTIAEYLNWDDNYHSGLNNITTYSFYKTENGIFIVSTNYSKYDWIGIKTCLPCKIILDIYSEEKNFTKGFNKNFFTDDITYTPFPETVGYSPTGKAYLGIAQASLNYGICKDKTSEECKMMLCNYIKDKTYYKINCDPECIVGKFDYTPFERDFVYSINSKTNVGIYTSPDGKNITVYHTISTYCI